MKNYSIIVALSIAAPSCLFAANPATLHLVATPASHVWLTGTSTLHPYASTSTLTQVSADLASDIAPSTAPEEAVLTDIAHRAPFQHFEVVIPVKGLKSGESGLDKNMWKTLKADQVPEIHFTLTNYKAGVSPLDGQLPFQASGALSIAGVTKDVVIQGTAQASASEVGVEGQYQLLMSDYGVKPPTLMFGAIKVADPVIIHFHLLFQVAKGVSQ